MNNKITLSLLGGALVTGSAFAGEVVAQPQTTAAPSFESALTVGYDSQYIFRGINQGDDLVSSKLSTAWTCARTGIDFNASAWYGSVNDEGQAGATDELDLTFGGSKDLGFARVNAGYIFYHFFDKAENAQELYAGLSKELACGTNVGLTYFWDIEQDNDGYAELGIDKSFEVAGRTIKAASTLGYLTEEGQLSHLTTKLSHDIAVGGATLTPYVGYVVELNDDVNFGSTSSATGQENEFVAGATLSVGF